jgi:hypothetical protein
VVIYSHPLSWFVHALTEAPPKPKPKAKAKSAAHPDGDVKPVAKEEQAD